MKLFLELRLRDEEGGLMSLKVILFKSSLGVLLLPSPPPQVWDSCLWGRWRLAWGVSEGSWGCGVKAGCPRRYSRWVVAWAWSRLIAGSSLLRLTSRPPEVFLCPSLREGGGCIHKFRDSLHSCTMYFFQSFAKTSTDLGWWRPQGDWLSL